MTLIPLAAHQAPPAPKLLAKARDFEAMAIASLLKPMFGAVDQPAAPFGGGQAEQAWQPFMEQAIAKEMEARGGLGLANAIAASLGRGR